MLDPHDLYDLDADAVLDTLGEPAPRGSGPVLVHLLDGFIDAGGVGRLTREHLLEQFDATRLVTFDADQLLDYRSKRSLMTFENGRWSSYSAPSIVVDHLRDAEGASFLLLHGAEPDLQWDRFVAAVDQVEERLGVSLTATVHGIPMAVPHTRPASATAHGTRSELVGVPQPWFGRAEVPASAAALLEYRLGEAGHDAVGFAVHVPHYLTQTPYPTSAMHGLRLLQGATGLDLGADRIEAAAHEATAEVGRQVGESEELRELVGGLEQQFDAFTRSIGQGSLLAQDVELPTADEIGAELERFLAQHSDD